MRRNWQMASRGAFEKCLAGLPSDPWARFPRPIPAGAQRGERKGRTRRPGHADRPRSTGYGLGVTVGAFSTISPICRWRSSRLILPIVIFAILPLGPMKKWAGMLYTS